LDFFAIYFVFDSLLDFALDSGSQFPLFIPEFIFSVGNLLLEFLNLSIERGVKFSPFFSRNLLGKNSIITLLNF